jgi:hypothetical protein
VTTPRHRAVPALVAVTRSMEERSRWQLLQLLHAVRWCGGVSTGSWCVLPTSTGPRTLTHHDNCGDDGANACCPHQPSCVHEHNHHHEHNHSDHHRPCHHHQQLPQHRQDQHLHCERHQLFHCNNQNRTNRNDHQHQTTTYVQHTEHHHHHSRFFR